MQAPVGHMEAFLEHARHIISKAAPHPEEIYTQIQEKALLGSNNDRDVSKLRQCLTNVQKALEQVNEYKRLTSEEDVD